MDSKGSRWIPLLAGSLFPLTVLLQIGGLTESWEEFPGNFSAYTKAHDTGLLSAGQALTLCLSLAGNGAFVLRVMAALDPLQCTFACISTLICAFVLEVVALSIVGTRHPPLSTSYWMAVASACAKFSALSLLTYESIYTEWRRFPFGKITVKQRSLLLSFTFFIYYLAAGSILFKFASDLSYLNALYFVVQSVLTCGFGDITPPNLGSRIATIFYYPVGIIFVGVLISEIRETVLAVAKRKFLLKLQKTAIGQGLKEKAKDSWLFGEDGTESAGDEWIYKREPGQTYEASLRASISAISSTESSTYSAEILVAVVLFLFFWLIGAMVFSFLEGYNYFTSLYFSFIAFSAIGYGDLAPTTAGGRAFYIVWGLMGIACLTILFSVLSDAWLSRSRWTVRSFVSQRLSRHGRRRVRTDPERPAPASPSPPAPLANTDVDTDTDTAALIRELQRHLRSVLRRDHARIRVGLQGVFDAGEAARADTESMQREARLLGDALLDDDDETVMMLLLKHCENQVQKLIAHGLAGQVGRSSEDL